ncbi:MAG: alpha/beta hydrolase [Ktedonobacteraceae bacterium]|nr:alpha/beta hydrolase [Ktedonobacteraceae bacterium]
MALEGHEVDGFIHRFEPASAQSTALPVLLLLHGTGGDENDLIDLGHILAPGAALLSPRGKVLENGMPRFFRRLAEGVFDLEDLKVRTQELADFVEAASKIYAFDAQHVIAVGFSNGANIAASMLLLRPEVLTGAVLSHPMVPLVPETLPDLSGKSIFIGAGRFDPLVPASETEHLAALLQEAGGRVTMQWQNSGHVLRPEEVRAARSWLNNL